jgi:hypothetical protein
MEQMNLGTTIVAALFYFYSFIFAHMVRSNRHGANELGHHHRRGALQ